MLSKQCLYDFGHILCNYTILDTFVKIFLGAEENILYTQISYKLKYIIFHFFKTAHFPFIVFCLKRKRNNI